MDFKRVLEKILKTFTEQTSVMLSQEHRLIKFLTQFNEFINHEPKPFKPMIDKVMKL